MRTTLIVLSLVAGSFLLRSMISPPTQDPLTLAQNEDSKPVLASPTPFPSPKPKVIASPPPSSTPAPNLLNDYVEKLKKCLEDKKNDPISQEIKKDIEIVKSPNSTSEEKNAATARLGTNNDIIAFRYDCFGTNFPNRTSDDIEKVWLIKDMGSGDSVIIERSNGEQWLLEAKTWCLWCWRYEGKQVLLKFGYTTSKLISDDGDVSEFWTEEEL